MFPAWGGGGRRLATSDFGKGLGQHGGELNSSERSGQEGVSSGPLRLRLEAGAWGRGAGAAARCLGHLVWPWQPHWASVSPFVKGLLGCVIPETSDLMVGIDSGTGAARSMDTAAGEGGAGGGPE